MSHIESLFVTHLYREELGGGSRRLLKDLQHSCRVIAGDDGAGQNWAMAKKYPGYTSYASLNDLPERDPAFAELVEILDGHVAEFARTADFDLGGRRLSINSIWINILDPGGFHASHIHPHSVVSGTVYLEFPKGASAIKFEDPRLPMMMAAPPRKPRARSRNQTFVSAEPKTGTLLLWESWLRHEVPLNAADSERISISFNYGW
ncbi:MAG: TIGR02466 family protein [Hyphomicrobium sp.]|nr:hypothetical protein [Hyphomicrobium sp.]